MHHLINWFGSSFKSGLIHHLSVFVSVSAVFSSNIRLPECSWAPSGSLVLALRLEVSGLSEFSFLIIFSTFHCKNELLRMDDQGSLDWRRRDGLATKGTCSSVKGPEYSFQHPSCWVAYSLV